MPEKPPAWTPSDGTIGQVPLQASYDVDPVGAPGVDANVLAAKIVRDQQPIINRFIKVQRQQIEIGQRDVHRAMLPLPGMDIYYQYVAGLERMHYHVNPEAEVLPEQPEQPAPIELPEIHVEALKPPELPEPPKVPEIKVPEIPEPPEPPEVPEAEIPEPEKPEEKKQEFGKPDFLEITIPYGLAVEFGDGAN